MQNSVEVGRLLARVERLEIELRSVRAELAQLTAAEPSVEPLEATVPPPLPVVSEPLAGEVFSNEPQVEECPPVFVAEPPPLPLPLPVAVEPARVAP